MTRAIKEVELFKRFIFGSVTDETKYGNDKVVDVITWLQGMLTSVPEQYRDSVSVEFEAVAEYDCDYPQIRIYYTREETEEEFQARTQRHALEVANRLVWAKRNLDNAAAELERLKKN